MADDDAPDWDDLPAPEFDSLPQSPDAPQASASGDQPAEEDAPPDFDELPPHPSEQAPPTKAEGPVTSFARNAAHAFLPGQAALAGAGAGAEAGAFLGPWGAAGGAFIGALAAGFAGSKIQDTALTTAGFDDSDVMAADAAENPNASMAGGIAGGLSGQSLGQAGVTLGSRAVGGGVMAAMDAGQQLATNGTIDPKSVAMSGIAGAVVPNLNRLGEASVAAGGAAARSTARFAGKVAGRPGVAANPEAAPAQAEAETSQQATVTGDTSLEQQAPPTDDATTIGNPTSAPDRSERTYPKDNEPDATGTPQDMLTTGGFAPDIAGALSSALSDTEAARAQPEPAIPGSDQPNLETMTNPGEQLPIKTGIADQAPAQETAPEAPADPQISAPETEAAPEAVAPEPVAAPEPEAAPETTGSVPAAPDYDSLPAHPTEAADKVTADIRGGTNEPIGGQAEAGNFKKGRSRLFGKEFAVETEKGQTRKSPEGVEPPWETPDHPTDYGYLRGTKGADGDEVDVHHVGTGDQHFVIDQRNPDGSFDEHKIMANAKDGPDAMDHYARSYSDGAGIDRIAAIKRASTKDITDWLNKGDTTKPYSPEAFADPTEGKTLTKKQQAVMDHIDSLPIEAAIKADAKRQFLNRPVGEQMELANLALKDAKATATVEGEAAPARVVNSKARPDRIRVNEGFPVEGIKNDQGQPVTANTKASALEKSKDVRVMNEAFDAFKHDAIPTTPEEKTAARAEVQRFVDDTKVVKYKPAVKHAPYLALRAAKKLLLAKNPSDKSWTDFTATVKALRSGDEGVKEVRSADRAEADIAMNKRGGDDAVAGAETQLHDLGRNQTEDDLIDKIDRERAEKNGFKNVDDEQPTVGKTTDIQTPADIKKFETKQSTLDLSKEGDRQKMMTDSQIAAENLVRTAARQAPLGESEGKASDVRKVKVDDAEKARIIEQMNKAMKKLPAEPEKPVSRVPAIDKPAPKSLDQIANEFLTDNGGALNTQKIIQDFRTKSLGFKQFLHEHFATSFNDTQRMVKGALKQVVSKMDSRMIEKAAALYDARYQLWRDTVSPLNQWRYMHALEDPANKNSQDVQKAMLANGIPNAQATWMRDEAKFHRTMMDNLWKFDAANGQKKGYVENYVSHLFEDASRKQAIDYIDQQIKTLGPQWYNKTRMFDLIKEAEQHGAVLKYKNPIDLMNARWASSIKNGMLMEGARRLEEIGQMFPTETAPDWAKATFKKEVRLADGRTYIMSDNAKYLWKNSMEAKGLQENEGAVGSAFRALMAVKKATVPINLALNAFHFVHVLGNIMPAQAMHTAFQDWKGGESFLKAYAQGGKNAAQDLLAFPLDKLPLVGPSLDSMMGKITGGNKFSNHPGRVIPDIVKSPDSALSPNDLLVKRAFTEAGMSPFQSSDHVIGMSRLLGDSLAQWRQGDKSLGQGAKIAWQGLQRGVEKSTSWMFKDMIPALKNAALLRALSVAVKHDPDLVTDPVKRTAVFTNLGEDIDDRFGEMFYKGRFWNKTMKDAGQMSMLSLSWNVGIGNQAGGAVHELMTHGMNFASGRETQSPLQAAQRNSSNKLAFVGHYVGLSMLSAGGLSWALSGQMPTGMDYFYPRTGDPDDTGRPGRVVTPFITREGEMLKAHTDESNSLLGGIGTLVWNKTVLQPLMDLAHNHDFFGHNMSDTNAPFYKRAVQTLDSTMGDLYNPIVVSGAQRADTTKGKVLSTLGFGPAPKYVNESPLERRVSQLYLDHVKPESSPYEYGPKTGLGKGLVQGVIRAAVGDKLPSEARAAGMQDIDRGTRDKNQEQIRKGYAEMREGGASARTKFDGRDGVSSVAKFARLPPQDQQELVDQMSQAEWQKYRFAKGAKKLKPPTNP